jgi:hypothetical protein
MNGARGKRRKKQIQAADMRPQLNSTSPNNGCQTPGSSRTCTQLQNNANQHKQRKKSPAAAATNPLLHPGRTHHLLRLNPSQPNTSSNLVDRYINPNRQLPRKLIDSSGSDSLASKQASKKRLMCNSPQLWNCKSQTKYCVNPLQQQMHLRTRPIGSIL